MKVLKSILKKYEWISMMIMGVICLKFKTNIYAFFPMLFGIFMLQCGILGCIEAWRKGISEKESQQKFEYELIKVLVAVGIMIRQNEAFITAGMFWGIAGLLKSMRYLNQILNLTFKKEIPSIRICIEFLMELVLSMMLVFEPIGNIEHHIVILGARLIAEGSFGILDESRQRVAKPIKIRKWKLMDSLD